eukprot:3828523-Pleurochrysis_carterae.AAC.2
MGVRGTSADVGETQLQSEACAKPPRHGFIVAVPSTDVVRLTWSMPPSSPPSAVFSASSLLYLMSAFAFVSCSRWFATVAQLRRSADPLHGETARGRET